MSTLTWTFKCVGCGGLAQAERRHAITCSEACRVRAHRNGSTKALRDLAAGLKTESRLIVQAAALSELRPDLVPAVESGQLEFDDTRADVSQAFVRLLFRVVNERVQA